GNYDVREALRRLIEGTGLRIVSDDGSTITLAGSGLRYGRSSRGAYIIQGSALGATPRSGEGEAAGAAANSEGAGDEEILVTAQRREQRLVDVPISMTAITADEIDRRGFVNSEDYLRGL